MSIRAIITRGIGPGGSPANIVTRGYLAAGAAPDDLSASTGDWNPIARLTRYKALARDTGFTSRSRDTGYTPSDRD